MISRRVTFDITSTYSDHRCTLCGRKDDVLIRMIMYKDPDQGSSLLLCHECYESMRENMVDIDRFIDSRYGNLKDYYVRLYSTQDAKYTKFIHYKAKNVDSIRHHIKTIFDENVFKSTHIIVRRSRPRKVINKYPIIIYSDYKGVA